MFFNKKHYNNFNYFFFRFSAFFFKIRYTFSYILSMIVIILFYFKRNPVYENIIGTSKYIFLAFFKLKSSSYNWVNKLAIIYMSIIVYPYFYYCLLIALIIFYILFFLLLILCFPCKFLIIFSMIYIYLLFYVILVHFEFIKNKLLIDFKYRFLSGKFLLIQIIFLFIFYYLFNLDFICYNSDEDIQYYTKIYISIYKKYLPFMLLIISILYYHKLPEHLYYSIFKIEPIEDLILIFPERLKPLSNSLYPNYNNYILESEKYFNYFGYKKYDLYIYYNKFMVYKCYNKFVKFADFVFVDTKWGYGVIKRYEERKRQNFIKNHIIEYLQTNHPRFDIDSIDFVKTIRKLKQLGYKNFQMQDIPYILKDRKIVQLFCSDCESKIIFLGMKCKSIKKIFDSSRYKKFESTHKFKSKIIKNSIDSKDIKVELKSINIIENIKAESKGVSTKNFQECLEVAPSKILKKKILNQESAEKKVLSSKIIRIDNDLDGYISIFDIL